MKHIIVYLFMMLSFSTFADDKIEDFEMYCSNVSIVYAGTIQKTISENYGMYTAVHNTSSGETIITVVSLNGTVNESTKITKTEPTTGIQAGVITDGAIGISKDRKSVYINTSGNTIFVHEDKNNCTKKYNSKSMKTLKSM